VRGARLVVVEFVTGGRLMLLLLLLLGLGAVLFLPLVEARAAAVRIVE